MRKYQQFLKSKYESLELISIDEQLDCSSSKYITLTLEKMDRQGKVISAVDKDKKGDDVTLSEALDIGGDRKGVTIIVIKGGPGMGKSTLAVNICKCWAKGSLLNCYDCVIMLTLRDPEIQAAKTISDLLLMPIKELSECLVKEIAINFGEKICFILEGYDELPELLQKSSIFTKLKEKLPKCTLVYTSRPEASDQLESVATRVIKIQGFKKESIDEYISSTFEQVDDGEKLASQLKSELNNNFVVKRILHIPINVAIVCLIFFFFSALPETLTELYKLLILRLILRHISTRTDNVACVKKLPSLDHLPDFVSESFSKLCYIAYKGTEKRNIIFTSQDLMNIGVAEKELGNFGLLVTAPSTSVYGREKSYNFLHKTVQEFCTAWYISKLSQQDQLKCVQTFWNDRDYLMVWRFYSGITELNIKEITNSVLPYKLVESYLTESKLQHLMSCVYEARNKELCQIIGDYLNHFNCTFTSNPHVIAFFLTSYKKAIRQMHFANLSSDGFQVIIQPLLERTQCQYDKDDLILHLSECDVTQQFIFCLIQLLTTQCRIVELYLREFTFASTDGICVHVPSTHFSNMQLLSQVITSSSTLRVLEISKTCIGPEGAVCFADVRNTSICDLRMAKCELGTTGADMIGEMLHHNKSIVSVDLSKNYIMDSGVERLVHHLSKNCQLQHLNLRNNAITAAGVSHLRILIETDHPTLTSIELSKNPLEDEGVHVILSLLTVITMEYIGLAKIGMTALSYLNLADIIQKTKSITFDLFDEYNDDGNADDTFFNCFLCISNNLATTTVLKHLEIHDSSVQIDLMLNAIKQNDKIETLILKCDHNFLDDCGELFFEWLKNTTSLRKLTISAFPFKLTPHDLLLLANSLTINNSIRSFQLADICLDLETILSFLEHLEMADTVEEITLKIMYTSDYHFFEDVDKRVQKINCIREANNVDCQIKVYLYTGKNFY